MTPAERARFGLYLKGLRASQQMSLRDVAAATGNRISAAYLSQVENALKPPPGPDVLRALAEAYGVDAGEVMRRAGVEEPVPTRVYDPVDLRNAIQLVLSDPRYSFGTYVKEEEMSDETKAFIVEMYQKARGLKIIKRLNERDQGEGTLS